MLIGFINTFTSFQNILSNLFINMPKFIKVYMNDIIIYSARIDKYL